MKPRNNPFRTERIGSLAFRSRDVSLEGLGQRLAAQGGRGAIVGPHGSGKTTLLRELGERMETSGLRVSRHFASEDVDPPPLRALIAQARVLGRGDALLFDGACHLPRWSWDRLRRACVGASAVLVTTHRDALLPTLIETRSDVALLEELTAELLGSEVRLPRPFRDELFAAHEGNLREALLALYDLAASDRLRVVAGHHRPDHAGSPSEAQSQASDR